MSERASLCAARDRLSGACAVSEGLRSTPIHLASLRSYYAAPIRDERKAEEHRQVVALIDAVQAARDYFGQSLPYSGDPDADLAQKNLRAALRLFTFEGYA